MTKIAISPNVNGTGTFTIAAPNSNTNRTLTLPDAGGEVFSQGNIIGTVSESSGVPTGAIIQRGSNSNGEFVRFADGTQICTTPEEAININLVSGSIFRGLAPIFPWPAAFASLLWSSSVPAPSSTVTVWGGNALNTNLTQTRLRLFSSQSLVDQSGYIIGFGRWF